LKAHSQHPQQQSAQQQLLQKLHTSRLKLPQRKELHWQQPRPGSSLSWVGTTA
jgi:hypothetical protein